MRGYLSFARRDTSDWAFELESGDLRRRSAAVDFAAPSAFLERPLARGRRVSQGAGVGGDARAVRPL